MSPSSKNDSFKATFQISGMHCASCELLLEQKLRKVKGVRDASVNYRTGVASLQADPECLPTEEQISRIVENAGYALSGSAPASVQRVQWLHIGASLLIIAALWKILQTFHIVSLVPSVNNALSLGGIFLIGLVAGTSSCLAVAGGLILALAAKYNQQRASLSPWKKFVPLLQFNIGRLVSYAVLGGIVGLIGQSISIGVRIQGVLSLLIAFIMLTLGLSILNILPKNPFAFRVPKRLSRFVSGLSESTNPFAPAALGALTFFLPCGFTQSLQLVALGSGSFIAGALTMGTFALGTLPSLIGISALSSLAKGKTSKIFLSFSGTLVLILALVNVHGALITMGYDVDDVFASGTPQAAVGAPSINNGVQEVSMTVTPEGYVPNQLTIKAGIPVRWTVDGTQAGGCTSGIIIPSLNISKTLTSGPNVIEFTAPTRGNLVFSCSMGMVRGLFHVI